MSEVEPAGAEAPNVDEMSHDEAIARLRSQQNFGLAVAAGLGSALIGAALWAMFVYVTQYEVGLIAVALGALVGFSVRVAGRGIDQQFGVLGAGCAAFGWVLGTAMVNVAMLAQVNDVGFGEAFGRVGIGGAFDLMTRTFDPMDILFLAIAVYEGYRFAFRYRIH